MKIYTDSIEFAEKYIDPADWSKIKTNDIQSELIDFGRGLFTSDIIFEAEIDFIEGINYLFLVDYAPESQYDALIKFAHNNKTLPDGIVCLAGSGKKFHGFHNRKWVAKQGNIHLSAYFSPMTKVASLGLGFTIVSALSVMQAIDQIAGLKDKARVKWVNDILIDGAKVSGVLAHTQIQGEICSSAIFGIGVNVETSPDSDPTEFVPKSACINEFLDQELQIKQKKVFTNLVERLAGNYTLLISGGYKPLLQSYVDRSLIIGKEVKIMSDIRGEDDKEMLRGKVVGIGENLELFFEGREEPVVSGRPVIL
ncbi:MAG: biotin--[acetyl-CoA-carboxylase] ligase [Candidatus Kapabacteria bacterium]|nr:biotin--[acetyl-CoA-carboxylase] ligase [Candidatus Kapabacteria bacterium]